MSEDFQYARATVLLVWALCLAAAATSELTLWEATKAALMITGLATSYVMVASFFVKPPERKRV